MTSPQPPRPSTAINRHAHPPNWASVFVKVSMQHLEEKQVVPSAPASIKPDALLSCWCRCQADDMSLRSMLCTLQPHAHVKATNLFCVQVLFHPCGSIVSCYQLQTGRRPGQMRGHMATINACCWSGRRGMLFTGSTDRSVLAWGASVQVGDVCLAGDNDSDESKDVWSGDDASPYAMQGVQVGEPGSGAARFSSAQQVRQGPEPGRQQSQGARERRRAKLGVRTGSVDRRAASGHPPGRVQRIAARLIKALQPHLHDTGAEQP
jgi:hypothetical protein